MHWNTCAGNKSWKSAVGFTFSLLLSFFLKKMKGKKRKRGLKLEQTWRFVRKLGNFLVEGKSFSCSLSCRHSFSEEGNVKWRRQLSFGRKSFKYNHRPAQNFPAGNEIFCPEAKYLSSQKAPKAIIHEHARFTGQCIFAHNLLDTVDIAKFWTHFCVIHPCLLLPHSSLPAEYKGSSQSLISSCHWPLLSLFSSPFSNTHKRDWIKCQRGVWNFTLYGAQFVASKAPPCLAGLDICGLKAGKRYFFWTLLEERDWN